MKNILPILFLLTTSAHAQSRKDTVALAFNEQLIATNKERAEFTGYAVNSGKLWTAAIYDLNLKLVARGSFSGRDCKTKEGWFTFYYPDGKRAASGQYHQDRRIGNWRTWYPSGKLRDSIAYLKDKPEGIYYAYHESGMISGFGKYKEGIEDSTWTWYHQNGQVSSVEEFYKGKLQGQRCTDSLGRKQIKNCELYREPMTVDDKTIWQLVYEGRDMPKDGSGKPASGVVTVDIHIAENGELKKMEVIPSAYPVLDSLVRNALAKASQWQPAFNHNRPVSYVRSISIPFGSYVINNNSTDPQNRFRPDHYWGQPTPVNGYYWNVDRNGFMRDY